MKRLYAIIDRQGFMVSLQQSQKGVAQFLGITRQTVSNYIKTKNIDVDLVNGISDDLIFGKLLFTTSKYAVEEVIA